MMVGHRRGLLDYLKKTDLEGYRALIENQFITLGVDAWGSGSALSFILLVLVLISMAVMRRAEREAGEEGGGKLW